MIRTLVARLLPRSLARRLGLLPRRGPTRFFLYEWDFASSPTPKWEGSPLFFTAYREGILQENPSLPPMPHATNWPSLVPPETTTAHE